MEKQIESKRKELKLLMERGYSEQEINEEIENHMIKLKEREIKNKSIKEIKKVENNFAYHILKEGIRAQYQKDKSLRFFINKNCRLKGKITNVIEHGVVEIPLVQKGICEKIVSGVESIVTKLFCFGEKRDKEFKIVDSITHKFYIYRMVVKENNDLETYILLSEKELNLEEYLIEGMLIDLDDFSEVTKFAKIMKKSHVVFVNNTEPAKKIYKSKEEFFEEVKKLNLTEDKLFEYLFSIKNNQGKRLYFQHPRFFERLIGAFNFSTKIDSSPYPLHLIIIGKQGGGKSKIMEALDNKMNENIPIVEGSGSTMKSLIPSFRGDMTRPGAMIESNRMCFIDEFFRILMRVDKDDRENTLTHMNPLLEHKNRRFGSGNNFLDGNMSSKLFSVTNPVFGTSTMDSLSHKLDNSFLSRIMIWYQDEEHYKEITSKTEKDIKEVPELMDKNMWLSIYDYLNSFKSNYDFNKLFEIYEQGSDLICNMSEQTKDIYYSRYKHHLQCILDGLIKLRCLIELDSDFSAKQEDYDNAAEIWFRMLKNWKKGIDNTRFITREGRFYNDN